MYFNQSKSTYSSASLLQLTTKFWRPPLVDFSSSSQTSICVGLKLVAQNLLLTVELAHVKHTTLEERSGIHHCDAISGRKEVSGQSHEKNVLNLMTNWELAKFDIMY